MIEAVDPHPIFSKYKAISTIVPFAVSLEQGGRQSVFDVTFRAIRASPTQRFPWGRAKPYTATLFEKSSPPSLNRVIVLMLPHVSPSIFGDSSENAVARWTVAVLAVPHTEEVAQSVVDGTLQIASIDSLRRLIPISVWAWLEELPTLPPKCQGRLRGTHPDVIGHVRALGDLGIIKSYFLLVWSEWEILSDDAFGAMEVLIRGDFCGTRMGRHREDLLQQLEHVIGELGRGLGYFRRHTTRYIVEDDIQVARERYGRLKGVLLEVERQETAKTLIRTSPRLTLFNR